MQRQHPFRFAVAPDFTTAAEWIETARRMEALGYSTILSSDHPGMGGIGPISALMLAASATMNIVGSMNRDTEGESYAISVNFKLSRQASMRAKRIFDFISSVVLLLASPVLYFFIEPKKYLWSNITEVMIGQRTWIAYDPGDPMSSSLPHLDPGVLSPVFPSDEMSSSRRFEYLHYVYARDYHWTTDLSLLIAQLKKIGQKPLSK